MQHFFVTPDQVEDTRIVVEGSDVNHMKNVLRLRPVSYTHLTLPTTPYV